MEKLKDYIIGLGLHEDSTIPKSKIWILLIVITSIPFVIMRIAIKVAKSFFDIIRFKYLQKKVVNHYKSLKFEEDHTEYVTSLPLNRQLMIYYSDIPDNQKEMIREIIEKGKSYMESVNYVDINLWLVLIIFFPIVALYLVVFILILMLEEKYPNLP